MKSTKGSAILLIIVIVAVMGAVFVGYEYYNYKTKCSNGLDNNLLFRPNPCETLFLPEVKPDIDNATSTPTFATSSIKIKPLALGNKYPIGFPVKLEWETPPSVTKVYIMREQNTDQLRVLVENINSFDLTLTTIGKHTVTIIDANNSANTATITLEGFNPCGAEYKGKPFNGRVISCYE